METPLSTYRVQLNSEFGFKDASNLVSFFKALGISYLYTSPPFEARQGSTHHYDVVNPTKASDELGGEEDFKQLADTLLAHGMGMMIDIVPNHMCVQDPQNMAWMDVLKKGRDSKCAQFFDIEWDAVVEGKQGRILLPFLGDQQGKEVEAKALTVNVVDGEHFLAYYGMHYPLCSESLQFLENIKDLLRHQHYWLDHWKKGATQLNYRRFFDVSELAGVRVELPDVFSFVHQAVKRWHDDGVIDGLRVDHIDGLRDPKRYCEELKSLIQEKYVVVEKILVGEEELDDAWDVEGTTGYDFLNLLNGLFIDASQWECLVSKYRAYVNDNTSIAEHLYQCKETVIRTTMMSEMYRLAREVKTVNEKIPELDAINGLIALVSAMPVYRTYFDEGKAREKDVKIIRHAIEEAKKLSTNGVHDAFWDAISKAFEERETDAEIDFVMTFQQITGAIMAKGVEDTFNYRFTPLASTNEVGSDPEQLITTVEAFHKKNSERLKKWPKTMLATSTHDTKRSEDVRARLNVLSEIPERWFERVDAWKQMNAKYKEGKGLDDQEEYFLYQTLIGAWSDPYFTDGKTHFLERIVEYMRKALREAKRHTSWVEPDFNYEQSVESFFRNIMAQDSAFHRSLCEFLQMIAYPSYLNSLCQVILKATVPGIPDFYQGSELWLYTLVDPDNRGQVDYQKRMKMLSDLQNSDRIDFSESDFKSGLAKLYVTQKVLQCRQKDPEVFLSGRYIPISVKGTFKENVIAFGREHEGKIYITIATRFLMRSFEGKIPVGEMWKDTSLILSPDIRCKTFYDVVHGSNKRIYNEEIPLSILFEKVPLALLEEIE